MWSLALIALLLGAGEDAEAARLPFDSSQQHSAGLMVTGQLEEVEACWALNWFKMSCAESQPLKTCSAWSVSELK